MLVVAGAVVLVEVLLVEVPLAPLVLVAGSVVDVEVGASVVEASAVEVVVRSGRVVVVRSGRAVVVGASVVTGGRDVVVSDEEGRGSEELG